MPTYALFALSILVLPASLAAQQRYALKGDRVAVYNLAGATTITAGSGSDVTVAVTTGGAQAGTLRVAQGEMKGRETLRVIYPEGDIVYPPLGHNSSSDMRVREDGTFGEHDNHDDRRVRIHGSGSGSEVHADLAITVPAGRSVSVHLGVGKVMATNVDGKLDIDASSADVQVNGGRGELSVDIGAGSVDVSGTSGDLSVDTGSGDVKLTNVKADALSVDTGSGEVVATGVTSGHTSIDTGSGAISLTGTRLGTSSLDTGSGDVTIDLAESLGDLSIDTGSGDVTLRLPATVGARLSLSTSGGRIDTDFPVTVTRTDSDELNGTIGDGKGRISVETGSGDVHLKKR